MFPLCLYDAGLSLTHHKNHQKKRKTEWCYFHSEKADKHQYEPQSQIITREHFKWGQSQDSAHAKAVAPLRYTSATRSKYKHTFCFHDDCYANTYCQISYKYLAMHWQTDLQLNYGYKSLLVNTMMAADEAQMP